MTKIPFLRPKQADQAPADLLIGGALRYFLPDRAKLNCEAYRPRLELRRGLA